MSPPPWLLRFFAFVDERVRSASPKLQVTGRGTTIEIRYLTRATRAVPRESDMADQNPMIVQLRQELQDLRFSVEAMGPAGRLRQRGKIEAIERQLRAAANPLPPAEHSALTD